MWHQEVNEVCVLRNCGQLGDAQKSVIEVSVNFSKRGLDAVLQADDRFK